MNRLSRNEVTTLVGVAVALLVIFQRPIQDAIQFGRDLEARSGLVLLPGLAVLCVVFVGHSVVGRLDRAAGRRRRDQVSQVVAMGQALTRASSMSTLRNRLREYLPKAAGTEGVWAVIRVDTRWVAIAGGLPRRPHEAGAEIESRADRLREQVPSDIDVGRGTEIDGHLCFSLTFGDQGVCVIGAPKPTMGVGDLRQRLASALAVLGISVHNVQLLTEIDEHAMLDGLTGCFNRTHGMKVLDAELQRAKRVRADVTLLILDLDQFKPINDQHGHPCGDAMLEAVGKHLHSGLRNSDVKIRYGGDEFMVLLPDTPVAGATHVAEILRQQISELTLSWEGHSISSTMSIGIAAVSGDGFDPTIDSALSTVRQSLISRADAALYCAKREGRNRVHVDQGEVDVQRWTPKFGQVAKVGSRPRRRSLACHGRDGVILLS